jgi:hypothetical protein
MICRDGFASALPFRNKLSTVSSMMLSSSVVKGSTIAMHLPQSRDEGFFQWLGAREMKDSEADFAKVEF